MDLYIDLVRLCQICFLFVNIPTVLPRSEIVLVGGGGYAELVARC
jgi:hypothetical protein